MNLIVHDINSKDYAPYGQVVTSRAAMPTQSANQGTATRYPHTADLVNARHQAMPHLSMYRVLPRKLPMQITLLECHPHATQVFLPAGRAWYLSVVALGDQRPDLSTLRAFSVQGNAGISYRPGVWHHPLIALVRPTDFWCLNFEDGTDGDCHEVGLDEAVTLRRLGRYRLPP
jgi:ureidoglycolate lyase